MLLSIFTGKVSMASAVTNDVQAAHEHYSIKADQEYTITYFNIATQHFYKIRLSEVISGDNLDTLNKLMLKKVNFFSQYPDTKFYFDGKECEKFKVCEQGLVRLVRQSGKSLRETLLIENSKFYVLVGSFLYSCISHNELALKKFHSEHSDATCDGLTADLKVKELAFKMFKQKRVSAALLKLNANCKPLPELSFLSDCYKNLANKSTVRTVKKVFGEILTGEIIDYSSLASSHDVFFIAISEFAKYQLDTQVITEKQINVITSLLEGLYDISCTKIPTFQQSLNVMMADLGIGQIPTETNFHLTSQTHFTNLILNCMHFLNDSLGVYGVFTRNGAFRLKLLLNAIGKNCTFHELAAGRGMCSHVLKELGLNVETSDIQSIVNPFGEHFIEKKDAIKVIQQHSNEKVVYIAVSPSGDLVGDIIRSKKSVILYITGFAHLAYFKKYLKIPKQLKAINFIDLKCEFCWNQSSALFFINSSQQKYERILELVPEEIQYAKVLLDGCSDSVSFGKLETFSTPSKANATKSSNKASIYEQKSKSKPETVKTELVPKTLPEPEPEPEKAKKLNRIEEEITTHYLDFPLTNCNIL